jgi:benzoyl-CoA reductase/2-hydroxyglutaryl-CoA dehydratase subunit BcrC/BadD/HgdB
MSVMDRAAAGREGSAELGGPRVGTIGHDVPVELIEAAGGVPFRLRGDPKVDTSEADSYLGTGVDPAARALLACLLRGDAGQLAGIFVSSDSEASQRTFFVLRELARVDPGLALPPVHLVDILHVPRDSTLQYNEAKLREMCDVLATWLEAPSDIPSAIAARNAVRRSARRLRELRRQGRLEGTAFLTAMLASSRQSSNEAVAAMDSLAEAASSRPPIPGVRVFLTGSGHDEEGVYAAFERNGALVVGDDHDGGELGIDEDTEGPTLSALALRYLRDATPQRASMSVRAQKTRRALVSTGAQTLVSYSRMKDDAPRWDFSAQARSAGVATVELSGQRYGHVDADLLSAALEGWRE